VALSGSFGTTFQTRWRVQADWSATQNVAGNYSDVTVKLYFMGLDSYGTTYSSASKSGSITINGSTHSFTFSAKITGSEKKLIGSHTVRVSHNSDGTKTFSMSASAGINLTLSGVYHGTKTISDSATLNTIPRASSVSSSVSWTAGTQNLGISVSRASSSFTHVAFLYVQTPSGTWNYIGETSSSSKFGASTTFSFNETHITRMYQAIGGYEHRPAKIDLKTYSGSTHIGTSTKTGTVYGHTPATINFSNFNIGSNVSATLSNFNSVFQYTVTMTFGGFSKSWTPTSSSFTMDFSPTDISNMYKQIPSANVGIGNVYVSSKYNGVELNDGSPINQNKGFTAYAVESDCKPTFTDSQIDYIDADTTVAGITGNNKIIVQNKSNFRAYLNSVATPHNHATIVKYVITVNGITKQLDITSTNTGVGYYTLGQITAGSNVDLKIVVTDSRGYSTTAIKTVTVVPYKSPTINAKAQRNNGYDEATTVDVSGTFSVIGTNTILSATYKKRTSAGSFGSAISFVANPNTTTGTYNATDKAESLDTYETYVFEFAVTDRFGTVTVTKTVTAGQPLFFMDIKKKSVGINKFPSKDNTLEVNGSIETPTTGYVTTRGINGHHMGTEMIRDYLNGNVTLSAQGGHLYLGYQNTDLVRLSSDLYASDGTKFILSSDGRDLNIADNLVVSGSSMHVHNPLRITAQGQFSTTDPWSGGAINISASNNLLSMGIGNTTNDRHGWIQARHSDANYPTAYGELRLNPLGGTVAVAEKIDVGFRSNNLNSDTAVNMKGKAIIQGEGIEMNWSTPYIDFKTTYTEDYDGRIILRSNGEMQMLGAYLRPLAGLSLGSGAQASGGGAGTLWYGNGFGGEGLYLYKTGWHLVK
jgi:hypothetical protein